MKYLNITKSTDVRNPNDGYPYVFYNNDISKVWIFLGLKWILEDGYWDNAKSWDSTGIWNFYGKPIIS